VGKGPLTVEISTHIIGQERLLLSHLAPWPLAAGLWTLEFAPQSSQAFQRWHNLPGESENPNLFAFFLKDQGSGYIGILSNDKPKKFLEPNVQTAVHKIAYQR
jgi:hypothetical protein